MPRNPICHLLALSGAHHILHISRIRVNFGQREREWLVNAMPWPLYLLERHLARILEEVGCASGAVWTGKKKI
jgi:hypothetical protein